MTEAKLGCGCIIDVFESKSIVVKHCPILKEGLLKSENAVVAEELTHDHCRNSWIKKRENRERYPSIFRL